MTVSTRILMATYRYYMLLLKRQSMGYEYRVGQMDKPIEMMIFSAFRHFIYFDNCIARCVFGHYHIRFLHNTMLRWSRAIWLRWRIGFNFRVTIHGQKAFTGPCFLDVHYWLLLLIDTGNVLVIVVLLPAITISHKQSLFLLHAFFSRLEAARHIWVLGHAKALANVIAAAAYWYW